MADGLLDMIIQSANFDNLTAVAADGLSGKSFVGKNGATYNGNIVDRGSPTHSLPVNGSITLSAGKYSGGTVKQNLITMNGYTVHPGSKNITVPTKDRYMTGNIAIASLPNLKPENIKEGEYVGGVGPGTWKGYVVTDPYTIYKRGTFGPGQVLDCYNGDYPEGGDPTSVTYEERDIFIEYSIHDSLDGVLFVSNSIDITPKNTLVIEYSARRMPPTQYRHSLAWVYLTDRDPRDFHGFIAPNGKELMRAYIAYYDVLKDSDNKMGYGKGAMSGTDEGDRIHTKTYDVSQISREVYFVMQCESSKEAFFKIHSVKFE